ncbi:PK beta-barrel-protein domain-containing protein-like protein [Thozetella sp. PMI_491]|nr:PK beta-barrel-protein domain-containing protein-like protein [Thozetella sp. PMI_491]
MSEPDNPDHGNARAYTSLAPLPPPDVILQVRSGKVRPITDDGVVSGINKLLHDRRVFVGKLGITGDERDYEPHRGADNALHQYCSAHYADWKEERPEQAHLFVPGAFGENLVTSYLNEDNVCIGDVFRIGPTVHVVVTGPRLPCFKLQHKFGWEQAAIRAQETNRIGWYYGIARTGNIEAGDKMVLVQRPYPTWSIGRVSHIMYRDKKPSLFQEILELDPLNADVRKILLRRLEKTQDGTNGLAKPDPLDWRNYKLMSKTSLTPRIKRFSFRLDDSNPAFENARCGAYPYVRLQFGPKGCYNRAYSVVQGDKKEFELGIALDRHSRGGSRFLHESLEEGELVSIAFGKNATTKDESGGSRNIGHRVFIVGGIGITAFISEIKRLEVGAESFEIHFACSSMDDVAYAELLPKAQTTYYAKNRGERLKVEDIFSASKLTNDFETEILCCGPPGLIDACQARAASVGYPDHLQHYESFGGDLSGDAFEIEIASSGRNLEVPEDKSILQVLEDAGLSVPSSCEVGNCGTCVIGYKSGIVEHRGTGLLTGQKDRFMLSCVSRGNGKIVLDF